MSLFSSASESLDWSHAQKEVPYFTQGKLDQFSDIFRRQTVEVIHFELIDNPLEEIQDHLFEDMADTELIEALNFEVFNYIVAYMKDDSKVSKTYSQEEAKAKKYIKRIWILAKERALLIKKLKRMEEK